MPDCDPAEDDETLLQDLGERAFLQGAPDDPGEHETERKNDECDKCCEAACLEQFAHLAGHGIGTMSEITLDCAGKVRCGRLRKLVPWQMNDDFDGRGLWQFQRPVDDVLFGLLVEVAFAER